MGWMRPYEAHNGESELDSRAPFLWRAVVASSLMVATAVLCSNAVGARSDDIIWEGDDQSVILAAQDIPDAAPNEHPVTLQPQDIETMLSGLRFRHADQEAETPPAAVFNKEQVAVLKDALAKGLSRATPSQDVTFSVVGAHRMAPGAIALRNRLTAGRAFYRDGKLNVIFGDIQSPYRKKNVYGRLEEDFYPRKFGSRTASEAEGTLLVTSTGATLRNDPGGHREDWIMFAASDASSFAAQSPRRTAGPQESKPAAQERPMPAAGELTEPAPAPRATTGGSAEASPATGPRPDIEQRLETLKRLREKDLISEEAYREKVDEVLDDL